jgi:hypothetical protein
VGHSPGGCSLAGTRRAARTAGSEGPGVWSPADHGTLTAAPRSPWTHGRRTCLATRQASGPSWADGLRDSPVHVRRPGRFAARGLQCPDARACLSPTSAPGMRSASSARAYPRRVNRCGSLCTRSSVRHRPGTTSQWTPLRRCPRAAMSSCRQPGHEWGMDPALTQPPPSRSVAVLPGPQSSAASDSRRRRWSSGRRPSCLRRRHGPTPG